MLAAHLGQVQAAHQAASWAGPPPTRPLLRRPGIYVNLPPFGPSCVGNANLVDIPTGGDTTLPADYDYNGVADGAPSPAAAPTLPPMEAPTAAPTEAPTTAPPVSSPPAAPAPVATPPTAGASTAGASLAAVALAVLAGALAL